MNSGGRLRIRFLVMETRTDKAKWAVRALRPKGKRGRTVCRGLAILVLSAGFTGCYILLPCRFYNRSGQDLVLDNGREPRNLPNGSEASLIGNPMGIRSVLLYSDDEMWFYEDLSRRSSPLYFIPVLGYLLWHFSDAKFQIEKDGAIYAVPIHRKLPVDKWSKRDRTFVRYPEVK